MRLTRWTAFAVVAALTPALLNPYAQEKKVDRSALPPAVKKTIAREQKGASIRNFATEIENGKKVYEAEMVLEGHTKDIQIAEDGTLNEVEEEVALASLPTSVQTALNAKASDAGATITKVESLTKHGKLVAFEAATLKGTKKGEIQVGPDGKKLAHPQ